MKVILFGWVLSLVISFFGGLLVIPILKKIKAGQTVLKYVNEHKSKNGTPTMGGLFFIIPSCIVYFLLNGFKDRLATVCVTVTLAFLCVGFLDDFIKIKYRKNEGLKAYQKIFFQFFISLFVAIFCFVNDITSVNIPFTKNQINIGVFASVLIFFVFIATTNSVNLTDGLDGLASSVSFVYLLLISIIIVLQNQSINEYKSMHVLTACVMGGICAFLCFNTNKASVFMGDTGSLALGGFIASVSVFTANALILPILGITFLFTSISVIMQVAYFKATKGKRIFLMSPFHHHLQMKGLSESKIGYIYSIVTGIMGVLLIISYL